MTGPGHRPGRGRSRPGARAADRGLRAGPGGRGRQRQPSASSGRCGQQAVAGLDRLYGVVPVARDDAVHVRAGRGRRPDRPAGDGPRPGRRAVRHRSLDAGRSTGSTSRRSKATARRPRRAEAGRRDRSRTPRYLAVGGRDLLILDAKNVLWRWRPADDEGKGTLTKVKVQGSTSWGDDIMGIDTFLRDAVARPLQPVRRRPVRAADPGLLAGRRRQRLPGAPTAWLATARDVSRDDLDVRRRRPLRGRRRRGRPVRRRARTTAGRPGRPATRSCAPAPTYSLVAGAGERRDGQRLRLRPAERPDRRPRQDGRHVSRPVPAGRRRRRTGRTCAAMYIIPGVEEAPADARLAVARRRPPGRARGRPGRRARGVAVGRAERATGEASPQAVHRRPEPGDS